MTTSSRALTGIPKVTFTGNTSADELRINLSIPVTPANSRGSACSAATTPGFPNGRRLNDDVVDIEEQAVAGFLMGNEAAARRRRRQGDTNPMGSFPYVADPLSGADDTHGEQH